MAATDDDIDSTEKSTFGCLDAARYVVAAAVTVLIVAVSVYAVTVVLRPGELSLWVVGGSVVVKRNDTASLTRPYVDGDKLTFSFTVRAVNPSGRVRIYYTSVTAQLEARNSSGELNSFLYLVGLPNMTLAQQFTVDSTIQRTTTARHEFQKEYFGALGNGTSIDGALLVLNGTRTVENYSGHYMMGEAACYDCSPIVVGGDKDDGTAAALDVPCRPTAAGACS